MKPEFHQLDITSKDSISKFADFINTKHGGLDVLVNNAAIAFKVSFSPIYIYIFFFYSYTVSFLFSRIVSTENDKNTFFSNVFHVHKLF